MSIGIFPNVNSIKLNRDAKQGTCVRSPHYKVGKGAVAFVSSVPQLGCLARRRAIRTSETREVSGKSGA